MAQVNLFNSKLDYITRWNLSALSKRRKTEWKATLNRQLSIFPLRHELLILLTSREANGCENHKIYKFFFGNCSTRREKIKRQVNLTKICSLVMHNKFKRSIGALFLSSDRLLWRRINKLASFTGRWKNSLIEVTSWAQSHLELIWIVGQPRNSIRFATTLSQLWIWWMSNSFVMKISSR